MLKNKTSLISLVVISLLILAVIIFFLQQQKKPAKTWTYIWVFDGEYSTLQKASQLNFIEQLKTSSQAYSINLSLLFDIKQDNKEVTAQRLVMKSGETTPLLEEVVMPHQKGQELLKEHIIKTQQELDADHYLLLSYDSGLKTSTVLELDKLLASASRKIDLIMFEADYQASLENAYLVKNGANYLIASQAVTQDVGVYDQYLNAVKKNSEPEQLAVTLAEIHFNEAKKTGQSTAISVINLSLIEQVTNSFNDLIIAINEKRIYRHSIEIWDLFDFSRNRTQPLENSFFDFFDFIRVYAFNATSAEIQSVAHDILNLKNQVVVYLATNSENDNCVGYCPNLDSAFGLSIYFPKDFEDNFLDNYLEYEYSLFLEDTYWDEMLSDYFYSRDIELAETPGFDEPLFIDCQPKDCNCDGVVNWKDWLCRIQQRFKK